MTIIPQIITLSQHFSNDFKRAILHQISKRVCGFKEFISILIQRSFPVFRFENLKRCGKTILDRANKRNPLMKLSNQVSAKSTKIIQAASDDDFEPTPPPPKRLKQTTEKMPQSRTPKSGNNKSKFVEFDNTKRV
ncbi:hypothetical protein R6Q59_031351 [Mikania micrantha]